MKKKCLYLAKIFIVLFILPGCKQKEKDIEESSFFPVLSYLKSQVAHVDTSLYSIKKIVIVNNAADTTFIKREEFRELANDFLTIPDLTAKKYKKMYTESKFFDESVKRVIITYTPNRDDIELRRQELHIIPDPAAAGDKISTIILDKFTVTTDSNVQKRLLWQVNERFQVVTTIQKSNQAEATKTLRVIWNEAQ